MSGAHEPAIRADVATRQDMPLGDVSTIEHSRQTSIGGGTATDSAQSSFTPHFTASPSSTLDLDNDADTRTGSSTVRTPPAPQTILVSERVVSEAHPPPTPAKERDSMYGYGFGAPTGRTAGLRPTSQYNSSHSTTSPLSPHSPHSGAEHGPGPGFSGRQEEARPPNIRRQSQVDWIVPTTVARDTVARRLGFTVDIAKSRHASLESHARLIGRALNAAIGLQVIVGALITGLASVTEGKQTSIMTSILGAVSIIIGAFLARMRGTGEPDLSTSRAKGWDKFLRSTEAYLVDHADEPARDHVARIEEFRQEFEELAGSANAEQKGNNV